MLLIFISSYIFLIFIWITSNILLKRIQIIQDKCQRITKFSIKLGFSFDLHMPFSVDRYRNSFLVAQLLFNFPLRNRFLNRKKQYLFFYESNSRLKYKIFLKKIQLHSKILLLFYHQVNIK